VALLATGTVANYTWVPAAARAHIV